MTTPTKLLTALFMTTALSLTPLGVMASADDDASAVDDGPEFFQELRESFSTAFNDDDDDDDDGRENDDDDDDDDDDDRGFDGGDDDDDDDGGDDGDDDGDDD